MNNEIVRFGAVQHNCCCSFIIFFFLVVFTLLFLFILGLLLQTKIFLSFYYFFACLGGYVVFFWLFVLRHCYYSFQGYSFRRWFFLYIIFVCLSCLLLLIRCITILGVFSFVFCGRGPLRLPRASEVLPPLWSPHLEWWKSGRQQRWDSKVRKEER